MSLPNQILAGEPDRLQIIFISATLYFMVTPSKLWLYTTILIAILVSVASLLGIVNPTTYSQESANWALQAVGQDVGNIIAVFTISIAAYFMTKKSLNAYFVWLGVLLYFVYAYLIYAFFIHFNYLFLVYVAILGLSTYTLIGGLLEQDLSRLLQPVISLKINTARIVLITIGTLFELLWLSEIIPAIITGGVPRSIETAGLWTNPVYVIDLAFVLPGMIITGILLSRKKLMGYVFAIPWLIFSVLMGSSIVVTSAMELNNGNGNAIVPMAMVGLIVAASAVALFRTMRGIQ